MATDTESMHENMTRLRMRMVQQKLANERERLQSGSSDNGYDDQLKLKQAMLKRQELLDKIRSEQVDDKRPRTYTPRRRYTPSPLPPPSRRSLPDLSKQYHFVNANRQPDMAQVKHVIEHQFRSAPQQQQPQQHYQQLPPIQTAAVPQMMPAVQQIAPPTPTILPIQAAVQPMPAYSPFPAMPYPVHEQKGTFNKGDMMEMMMMQNAQMHHMVMQQMMLSHLPGGGIRHGQGIPYTDVAPVNMVRQAPSVYHHHIQSGPPPMDYRRGIGNRGPSRTFAPRRPQRAGRPNRAAAVSPLPNRPTPPRSPYVPPIPVTKKPAVVRTDNVIKKDAPYPFPGPKGLRKLRHIAYAAWFINILKSKANATKRLARPSSVFLFGIILKEIVAALHRIYLNPNGNIYPVLMDVIGTGSQDLTTLMTWRPPAREQRNINRNDKDDPRPQLLQTLQYVVENLVYHMTEIMPKTGVLGTHKKSAVFELMKNGKRFPDGYFWQIELDRLDFDGSGRTVNVGNLEAFVLLVGIFLSRSFITTLLLKPVDYGISTEALTETAERNIRVLATCLLFLVRRVSTKRDSPMMPMPGEVARYVFTDEEMKPIHLRLKKTYEYCENLLREWGAEYIKRLREATNAATTNDTVRNKPANV